MSLATAEEDAGSKFWRMPEMIEKLLEYLDEDEVLTIVGVNLISVEVFKTASRTSQPLGKLIWKALGFGQPQLFEQEREKVQRMSNTLLAQLNSPDPLLLEVLDVICASNKYVIEMVQYPGFSQESAIRISCPLHNDHLVSPLGFILLEDCEAAIGSTKQRVIKIDLGHGPYCRNDMRDTLISALVSRLVRQEVAAETLAWHNDTFEINNSYNTVPANLVGVFNALLQRCDHLLNLKTVKFRGELGVEGWRTLALAM